jgi:hypothetical protein
MLGLVQLLAVLADGLLYWRMYSVFLATLLACLGVMALVPDGLAQWLVCTPVAVAGIALGFVWQYRASIARSS